MTEVPTFNPDRSIPVVLTEGLVLDILYGLEQAAAEYHEVGFCADCNRTVRESGISDLPCENHAIDFAKADRWLDAIAALKKLTGITV
ncbi:hypothetical protein [Nonomuraea endophytica]|uniref:Uncharacterized protein n=1 Tax=Nonomuraea endophytica TaxID=714136 RepID=A0A7W8EK30_9ACTN|nr:hypothetical protein [Nonomuraea endophytica]MBB5081282.1 hypothetical protein [Nonomuraea endophytica]